MSKERILKVFFFFLGGLIVVNLLLLDFVIFTKKEEKTLPEMEADLQATAPADTCDSTCQEAIARAVATLAAEFKKTPFPTAPSTPSVTPKEVYIPVGAGSTSSLDWTDIPGAEVFVDTIKYGKIKEAYFEAQLRVPTANGSVCARIFNQTDKAFVFSSEVCSTSQKGERVTSPKISLYSGNKLYRIQMKVTMPYEGILDLGRIKLVWE